MRITIVTTRKTIINESINAAIHKKLKLMRMKVNLYQSASINNSTASKKEKSMKK